MSSKGVEMAVYHVKADVKNFSPFCGHLPLSPLQLCRLFTYDTYVNAMENAFIVKSKVGL